MKKVTLIMIASAAMLFATPAMMMDGQGMKQMKQGKQYCNKNYCKKKCNKNRTKQKKMNSPFLIKHGLPHMHRMIMPYLNDPSFNLTSEQKFELAKLRITSMSAIKEAKPKIAALRNEIIKESQKGVDLETLKLKVAKLALLESTATLIQLQCIKSTKEILTKDQLYFLLVNKNKNARCGKLNKCQKKCKKQY